MKLDNFPLEDEEFSVQLIPHSRGSTFRSFAKKFSAFIIVEIVIAASAGIVLLIWSSVYYAGLNFESLVPKSDCSQCDQCISMYHLPAQDSQVSYPNLVRIIHDNTLDENAFSSHVNATWTSCGIEGDVSFETGDVMNTASFVFTQDHNQSSLSLNATKDDCFSLSCGFSYE